MNKILWCAMATFLLSTTGAHADPQACVQECQKKYADCGNDCDSERLQCYNDCYNEG